MSDISKESVLGMVKALNMSKWNAVCDLLMKEGYFS